MGAWETAKSQWKLNGQEGHLFIFQAVTAELPVADLRTE
jgi:hypothetical protein